MLAGSQREDRGMSELVRCFGCDGEFDEGDVYTRPDEPGKPRCYQCLRPDDKDMADLWWRMPLQQRIEIGNELYEAEFVCPEPERKNER